MGRTTVADHGRGKLIAIMTFALLALLLVAVVAPVSAAPPPAKPYAIRVEPRGILPTTAKAGDTVTVPLKLTNVGTTNFTGLHQLQVQLIEKGVTLSERMTYPLNINISVDVDFTFKAIMGTYDVTMNASAGSESAEVYNAQNLSDRVIIKGFSGTSPKPYAIRVEPQGTHPITAKVGDTVSVSLKLTNVGTTNFTGLHQLLVQLSEKGETLSERLTYPLNINKFVDVVFTFKAVKGTYDVTIDASAGAEYAEVYNAQYQSDRVIIKDFTGTVVEQEFNWTPIIAIIVVIAILGVVAYFVRARGIKKEEERRIAEEARRQEIIRKKEAEIAKKIEVRDVLGKHPRDYYVLRRQKYARMKPSGMTSSGLNVLKHEKSKEEIAAEHKFQCPKCGTVLPAEGAQCPRCNAIEKIENVRHQIRHYKSRDDIDFKDAESLLRKAEHRINWSDFSGAMDFVRQAETKMIEDYQTYRRGGRIIETVSDKTDGQGPTKDAKIIGMQGEKMPVMPSERPHAGPLELPDDGATGTPCPKCGRPMYDNICFYDDFDKALNATWATIEEGETDGAPLTEQKDLTRQAATAKEHGSGEQGVRYLRRAYILSKETVASHARSKSEGIINFTWTLFKQVEVMGEDTSMARQMLEKAEAALKAGDDKQARSYAAKADGFLKQLREDGYRKRANDMLLKASAQPMQSAAANDLVEKAKKLIAAKEYEGAVDLLEAARAKK